MSSDPAQTEAPNPVAVYVKWTHQSYMPTFAHESERPPLVYHYDVPICPSEPLRVGTFVKLLLLSNAVYRPPFFTDGTTKFYDAYDVHIHGSVINVHEATEHALTLTVRNSLPWSPVRYAHITLPYIPKLTVAIDGPLLVRQPGQNSSLASRTVELEHNVEIYDPPRSPPRPPASPLYSYFSMDEHGVGVLAPTSTEGEAVPAFSQTPTDGRESRASTRTVRFEDSSGTSAPSSSPSGSSAAADPSSSRSSPRHRDPLLHFTAGLAETFEQGGSLSPHFRRT